MSLHHTEDPICPLCEEKLKEAHPDLAAWFHRLKVRYVNVHVSWAWRGPKEQNQMFEEKKSKLRWPYSPHNHTVRMIPCALALDLFQIDDDGLARFIPMFYAKVTQENERDREPIRWGGRWKTLGDYNHFELILPESPIPAA